jgi:hypothetical protein
MASSSTSTSTPHLPTHLIFITITTLVMFFFVMFIHHNGNVQIHQLQLLTHDTLNQLQTTREELYSTRRELHALQQKMVENTHLIINQTSNNNVQQQQDEQPTHTHRRRRQLSTPTEKPTKIPTTKPTKQPTKNPTTKPTKQPTTDPTIKPTKQPTTKPTSFVIDANQVVSGVLDDDRIPVLDAKTKITGDASFDSVKLKRYYTDHEDTTLLPACTSDGTGTLIFYEFGNDNGDGTSNVISQILLCTYGNKFKASGWQPMASAFTHVYTHSPSMSPSLAPSQSSPTQSPSTSPTQSPSTSPSTLPPQLPA